MRYLFRKLRQRRIWNKVFIERLTEPIHLNILSLFYLIFGSYKKKISYDLIARPQHAFSILKAAEQAKKMGIRKICLIEFGVASGGGLLNMAEISKQITKITGVEFEIYGFDTGAGMPMAIDYRDHPEIYQLGDFDMNLDLLKKISLPIQNC